MAVARRSWLPWIAIAAVVLAAGAWWWTRDRAASETASRARRSRTEARERRLEEHWTRVEEESAELMPELLAGVRLGMHIDEARRARPGMRVPPAADPGEPGVRMLEERFENGARAVYIFETADDRLQRVQVLSLLPGTEHIHAHLTAMNEQYGTPTGVWDCPDTGGVATRRFTWRHGRTTISDVFLIYGGRVSVTLYIAPSAVIQGSLLRARCQTVRREDLDRFPVTPAEQLQDGVQ